MHLPRILRGGTAVLSFSLAVACTSGGDAERPRSGTSETVADSLRSVSSAVELAQTDSVFVSEPSALAVTDDRLFVADAGTSSILVYDRNGAFLHGIGRRGRGPGEFVAPAAMSVIGEGRMAIADAALQRISIIDKQFAVTQTLRVPVQALSLSAVPQGFVLGAQDPISKTSALYARIADSSVRRFGSLPNALVENPQLAASYPFSVVAYVSERVVIGFTGSEWLYRATLDGKIVDSVRATARIRRGVPDDLAERLRKSTSPENEAQSISMLVSLAPLSGGRTAMVHMDFVVDGPAVTGKAYFSALNPQLQPICRDVVVPLERDTRPMFAFHADTLFVVQNRLSAAGEVRSMISSFPVTGCS